MKIRFFAIVCTSGKFKQVLLTSDKPYQEDDLLLRIASGDEAAFATLFANYRDKIYSTAFELTRNSFLAEEIVQDVFFIIWSRRKTLPSITHFTAYLFTIARNEIYAAIRRMLRFERQDSAGMDAILLQGEKKDPAIEAEHERILREAVQRLPLQQREVYQLIREQGYKRDEAAAHMNISPETVKSYLAEAMRHIRRYCLTYLKIILWILLLRPFL